MVVIALVATALVASANIAPYNHAFAKKRYSSDNNAQPLAAANDCPAWLEADNFISAAQEQATTNCLIDTNMVQDSDGRAIASVPSNTGPSQDQKIKLDIDVGLGDDVSNEPGDHVICYRPHGNPEDAQTAGQ